MASVTADAGAVGRSANLRIDPPATILCIVWVIIAIFIILGLPNRYPGFWVGSNWIPLFLIGASIIGLMVGRSHRVGNDLDQALTGSVTVYVSFAGIFLAIYFIGFGLVQNSIADKTQNASAVAVIANTSLAALVSGVMAYFVGRYSLFSQAVHVLANSMPPSADKVEIGACLDVQKGKYATLFDSTARAKVMSMPPVEAKNEFRKELAKKYKSVLAFVRECEPYLDPPGSVFVTVGIWATFLGLAVALCTLDISVLIVKDGVQGKEDTAWNAYMGGVTKVIGSFVHCAGLALGMSMVGVMTAVISQMLSGKCLSGRTLDAVLSAFSGDDDDPNRGKASDDFGETIEKLSVSLVAATRAIEKTATDPGRGKVFDGLGETVDKLTVSLSSATDAIEKMVDKLESEKKDRATERSKSESRFSDIEKKIDSVGSAVISLQGNGAEKR